MPEARGEPSHRDPTVRAPHEAIDRWRPEGRDIRKGRAKARWSPSRILAAAAFACLASTGAARAADPCEGIAGIRQVSAEPIPVAVHVEDAADPAGIAVAARSLSTYLGPNWHANGLASARLRFKAEMRMLGRGGRDGACYGLDWLRLSYGYPDGITVQVSRRYPRGSCPYGAIMGHEFEHVRIYTSSVNTHAEATRTFVEGYLKARLPVRAPTDDEAMTRVKALVEEATDKMTKVLADGIERENGSIDEPGSYARVQALCSDW